MNPKISGRARAVAAEEAVRGREANVRAAGVRAAYRLRRELGPTVAPETIQRVRRELEAEANRLLAEGVSPRLLGLVD
jgi:hypothetical protein